jgi:protein phosphatase
VSPLPDVGLNEHLRGWDGITVIADVHGDLTSLEEALAWAKSRRRFAWLLGDTIDYGSATLATLERVHEAVMWGEAALVLGNHERKIARWLDQERGHMRLSDGNRVTTNALERLPEARKQQWIGRFRALLAHASLTQQVDNVMLIHAAAHPSLWTTPDRNGVEHLALYGESDHSGGRYRRSHNWVDSVPKGKLVIVGHEIISDFPLVVTGKQGGQVVFLDTGCGKGGRLSSADLRFAADGTRLECFKRY